MAYYKRGGNDRNPARSGSNSPTRSGSNSPTRSGSDNPNRGGSNRPYRGNSDRPNRSGADYPFKTAEEQARDKAGQGQRRYNEQGVKPYYKRDNEQGAKPYYKRDNEQGAKPYYKRDNEQGAKPYYKRDNEQGAKPYYKRDGEQGAKPYYKRDNEQGAKPYYKKDGGKPYPQREESAPVPPQAKPEAAPVPTVPEDELPYLVMGRNAVREAVKSGRSIDRILVTKEQDGSLREVISLARDRNLQIREVDRAKLDELCMPFGHGGRPGNHQGILAQVPGVEYCDLSDILDAAKEKNQPPFVILLDGMEDPHNLGSILRSAECAGAHGVVITKRRCVGVTAAACKASAGASEYMKVAKVSNLSGAIARLKDAGLWIVGADMSGKPMGEIPLKGAIGLVIGSEGEGVSKLVAENCDFLASIPMMGRIDSLNASVAAAVLMYEKVRQDGV